MFDFLLYTIGEEVTFGEKMLIGGQVTLLGMGTVFAVLALLWGLVELLHFLLKPFTEQKKPKAVEPAAPIAEEPVQETDDSEIVAAIIAAVSAATGKSPSAFRVVSFKRANRNFASGK